MEPDFITDDLNALIRLLRIYIYHCSDIFLCGFNHVMSPVFFSIKENVWDKNFRCIRTLARTSPRNRYIVRHHIVILRLYRTYTKILFFIFFFSKEKRIWPYQLIFYKPVCQREIITLIATLGYERKLCVCYQLWIKVITPLTQLSSTGWYYLIIWITAHLS